MTPMEILASFKKDIREDKVIDRERLDIVADAIELLEKDKHICQCANDKPTPKRGRPPIGDKLRSKGLM